MALLQRTVVDEILETLYQFGVRHIFGMPGDAINELVDGVRQYDGFDFIQVRHEEAGALAASAQAKLSGTLGVCVGTAGGGAIHLLNGLYDAKLDGAPVLAITGQVGRDELGLESHQEIDSRALFEKVARFNEIIMSERQVPTLVEQACQEALVKHSVSHLALPDDVAAAKVPRLHKRQHIRVPDIGVTATQVTPAADLMNAAVEAIDEAEKPVILAGIGALSAKESLTKLADTIGAPIIHSLRAKELLHDQHPLSLGGLGMLGTKPAQEAIETCDLLLMVGTDFPYSEFYPDGNTTVVQIDTDATRFGRRSRVDIALQGDARSTLNALAAQAHAKNDKHFMHNLQEQMQRWREEQAAVKEMSAKGLLNPQWVANVIGNCAKDNAVFVCDTGAVTAWVARHLNLRESQRFTLSANLATMGFGMSGAIGAQLVYPDRQVVAISGDGGFGMLMQDFITAVKYQLPIKVVVFNNDKLGLIQMEQEAKGNPEYQTQLHNPDFAAFAELCGGRGWSVSAPEQLVDALEAAFSVNAPCVIDVAIDPNKIIKPPKLEIGQMVNYSMAKVKELFASTSRH